ncbi:phage/plasmid primase, P4 family [Paenirhodobacter sp.]|uniref:phage/plasmid primase, P4 family n=1 Tax=Paenirhodobacter sp. TaxID=1965326 RepID=UPI003B510ACF
MTIDLRTGERCEPRPEDMITRRTAVAPDPSADCPIWRSFISFVTQGDEDLERFLQAFCGYTLTGLTNEHQLLFFFGPGGNGKSLFLNTIAGIMGDYAQFASMDTFAASKFERHSTDLAAMRGARLVAVSEVPQGVGWNETRLAQMTGGDVLRARFMRQDEFEYRPEFKIIIVGNHKPELRNVNDAMRTRMNFVPFSRKPETPDLQLAEKLKAEWPAILQWMIRGCLDWQSAGLVRPQVVRASTEEYFEVQDTFSQWIDECCILDPRNKNCWSVAVDLFHSWKAYAEARADNAGTMKAFGDLLRERGHERSLKKISGKAVRIWQGIMLRSEGGLYG